MFTPQPPSVGLYQLLHFTSKVKKVERISTNNWIKITQHPDLLDCSIPQDADADDHGDDGECKGVFIHSSYIRDLKARFSIQEAEKTKLMKVSVSS